MTPCKKLSMVIVFLFVLIILSAPVFAEKSVYVISDTQTSQVQAYKVSGNSLVYQTNYFCQLDPPDDAGAVGVALDESEYGDFLFFTFENTSKIEIVNAKTMHYFGYVTATGAINLAGIVVDKGKKKVYAIDRQYSYGYLYVYSWDAQNRTLTPDLPYPYYIQLQDCGRGFGIALDETHSRLYVGDNTNRIKYYNTNTWSKEGEISASCDVVSVAVDVPNQFLYYGKIAYNQPGNTNLYKYDISSGTPGTPPSVSIGCSVAGITVDQQTSLVYITTFGVNGNKDYPNPPQDRLMIYNSSLVKQSFESGDIGNPAGVIVGSHTSYNPPRFIINKANADTENNCVKPFNPFDNNYLVFDIDWNANSTPDTNVVITDYLPKELDYYSSSPAGDYNSISRTVKWSLGNLTGSETNTFHITTKVNDKSCPCRKIRNVALIEGFTYCTDVATDVNVCFWGDGIIYVDKDATGYETGTIWSNAYSKLQDALETAGKCPGADSYNSIWVAEGTYKPVYNTETGYQNKTFNLISDVSLFGHFGGTETSFNQRDFSNDTNETILEGQIGTSSQRVNNIITAVSINDSVVEGFTIKSVSQYGIYLEDCNVVIENCKFNDYLYGLGIIGTGNSTVSNCIFDGIEQVEENAVMGIYISGSSAELTGCVFKNNNKSITSSSSALTIRGCSFGPVINDNLIISGGSTSIFDSVISNSQYGYGIDSINSNLEIDRSIVSDNYNGGLYYSTMPQRNLTLKGNIIRNNYRDGINIYYSGAFPTTTTIINNWIHNNSWSGIYITNPVSTLTIRNNTIYHNSQYGISGGAGNVPEVRNCIIYNNSLGALNGTFTNVNYCWTSDPGFMNPSDPNDLHLDSDSPCIDKGDSNGIPSNEKDIDGEARVVDGDANSSVIVDIGADEFYWSSADFDRDGDVDFIDYAKFAYTWRRTVQNGNFTIYDLNPNLKINCGDLKLFCNDWLWEAAWLNGWMYDIGEGLKMMAQGGESSSFVIEKAAVELSVQKAVVEQPVVLTEADVKDILEWMDKVELESQAEGLSSAEDYKEFRQSLEKELISLLSQGEK